MPNTDEDYEVWGSDNGDGTCDWVDSDGNDLGTTASPEDGNYYR